MRKQFVDTVENLLSKDNNLVLLLGDISVHGFRFSFENYKSQIYNIGILEQSTIGLAAGLAKTNLIPIVHTIAPFLIERSYEQLKIDFGYQKLGGNFVSVGASYDYAALGCTHHCPADVSSLLNIPNFEITVPGNANEFNSLFQQSYNNGNPTYYRLSESKHNIETNVIFGKANKIKNGKKLTIIVIGPLLSKVIEAVVDLDVTILYYTTIMPFDDLMLIENLSETNKILVVEPFYSGTLDHLICKSLYPKLFSIDHIAVPREFLTNYGTSEEHDLKIGFSILNIRNKVCEMIKNDA
jgi:transketolase